MSILYNAGYVSPSGYRQVAINNKYWPAHKVSYVLNHGHLDEGLVVRHTCHNKRGINPSHLISGTDKENAPDNIDAGNLVQNPTKQSASRSRSYGLDILNRQIGEIEFGLKRLAKKLGIGPKRLRRLIDKQLGKIGQQYEIVGKPDVQLPYELTPRRGSKNPNATAVRCVDTGATFETVTAAARSVGVTTGTLSEAIINRTKCGGCHRIRDEPNEIETFIPKPNLRFQRVMRLDTCQVYKSIKEAAADIRRKPGNIARVLDKPGSKMWWNRMAHVEMPR